MKIRPLGRVAAAAVAEDEAQVDETQELLRITEQIEAVDIRALEALSQVKRLTPTAGRKSR